MVRKVGVIIMCIMLCVAAATPTFAYTHEVYDSGSISSTYLTYYRDILAGVSINDNYVAFRDGQNSYIMVVGKLEEENSVISLTESGKAYIFSSTGTNYSQQYRYNVEEIDEFSVNAQDYIIYSDVGDYPQLIERGSYYEVITAVLISIACICVVIRCIFRKR